MQPHDQADADADVTEKVPDFQGSGSFVAMKSGNSITNSSTDQDLTSASPASIDGEDLTSSYQQMLQMTFELVQDVYLNLRTGDTVITSFGNGTILKKLSSEIGHHTSKVAIKLEWGATLHCPMSDLIHKRLSSEEYEQAMDHLEQIRKLQLAIQCQEWGITLPSGKKSDEACVACLFQKPELYANQRQTRRYRPWSRSNTGKASSTGSDNINVKTQRCDVCGNPVCVQHKIKTGGDHEHFTMCVDCSHDLNQTGQNFHTHHPELLKNVQRLVEYYTRMSLQLSFLVPNVDELAHQLTHKQKRDGAISLGNSALGFVGAALGVAGAAAMLTPAGPAIILAAVATSATSGTFQGMHASYNMFLSSKTVHQLTDRCLGWHGLCLGILNALEKLRQDLIAQEHEFQLEQEKNADASSLALQSTSKVGGSRKVYKQSDSSLDIWNSLAVGSFATTRQAMTGVGVTSAMGASYSQAINTSLQGIPVVGAAFSVGCMAMDANNMASSFKMLNTPAKKAVALHGVQHSFPLHIPTTIQPEAVVLKKAVDDLQVRMAMYRQEEERLLIEQELEGLGGDTSGGLLDEVYADDDIERELVGL